MSDTTFPSPTQLMWPVICAIKALGGSGRNNEIVSKVIELENYSEDAQSMMAPNGTQTNLEYRLSWARTQLKRIKAIDNVQPGLWAITDVGEALTQSSVLERYQKHVADFQARRVDQSGLKGTDDTFDDSDMSDDVHWTDELLGLLKAMEPSAFERLTQRLLRAAGFKSVHVTGKAGDQGIDGEGILQVNLITFSVGFQCKRYSSTVGPATVRDFQGSIQGKHEKGLIITTATFSKAAQEAARRPGVIAIDLINGTQLCELLAQNELGITKKMVPEYTVDVDWYNSI